MNLIERKKMYSFEVTNDLRFGMDTEVSSANRVISADMSIDETFHLANQLVTILSEAL